MALIPHLPWALSHKIEYLSLMWSHAFLLGFVVRMLNNNLKKSTVISYYSISSLLTMFFNVSPSTFYSNYVVYPIALFIVSSLIFLTLIIYRFILYKKNLYVENVIVIICLLINIVSFLVDIFTSRNYNISPFNTIFIVFFFGIAITIQFSRTERELNSAKEREQKVKETNIMLSKMDELKNDFLQKIAHEMKTPLALMSGFAQLTN